MRWGVTIELCGHKIEIRGGVLSGTFYPDSAFIEGYPDDVFALIGGESFRAGRIEHLAQAAYLAENWTRIEALRDSIQEGRE